MANRGSILYFLIVEMSNVNVMYQTSLRQVLVIFDNSVKKSKASTNLQKRIVNILDYLTKSLWKYTNRSLYEKHKFLFTLLLALKIDMNTGNISFSEFNILLKGGALLDLNSVKVSPEPAKFVSRLKHFNFLSAETFPGDAGRGVAEPGGAQQTFLFPADSL